MCMHVNTHQADTATSYCRAIISTGKWVPPYLIAWATSLVWLLAVLLETHARMGQPKPPEALQSRKVVVSTSAVTCRVLQQLQILSEFGILGGGRTCITGKESR